MPGVGDETCRLIVFTNVGASRSRDDETTSADSSAEPGAAFRQLKHELHETRIRLETSIEDRDNAVEELQSANEELETSKEELQSVNEELQSANEDLQSANEELETKVADISTDLRAATK